MNGLAVWGEGPMFTTFGIEHSGARRLRDVHDGILSGAMNPIRASETALAKYTWNTNAGMHKQIYHMVPNR